MPKTIAPRDPSRRCFISQHCTHFTLVVLTSILTFMATMLITGGAGFIGSHLAEALLAGGHDVVLLDDFSTGRKENLSEVLKNSTRVEMVQDSVENAAAVGRLI